MLSDDEKRKLAEMVAKTIVNKIGNADSGVIHIDGDDLKEAFADEGDGPREGPSAKRPLDIQESVLVDMYAHIQRPCPFKPGDRVIQSKACGVYNWPTPQKQLAIVMEVRDGAVFERHEDDSNLIAKYDMVIAVLASNGKTERWMLYDVESWRFEKYESQAAKH